MQLFRRTDQADEEVNDRGDHLSHVSGGTTQADASCNHCPGRIFGKTYCRIVLVHCLAGTSGWRRVLCRVPGVAAVRGAAKSRVLGPVALLAGHRDAPHSNRPFLDCSHPTAPGPSSGTGWQRARAGPPGKSARRARQCLRPETARDPRIGRTHFRLKPS
ncbi:hypothetical protein BCV69DRAFT_183700 [Microstroma glucosiphilum]|uniref:Uncharacterized protein n=1 Tax=Pseudomicrostroma glucosiphilum TaxID=1684307 RepID=A0A316U9J2_9BASI|nr:hypothetical protein BCV69DRAFT_183700 [Pseudomicrostroma glucosiphilum]PWN21073.1 hypothetical protein BCV69DRAFT_183700 [Pseudomicrostroma glucosiphilum]